MKKYCDIKIPEDLDELTNKALEKAEYKKKNNTKKMIIAVASLLLITTICLTTPVIANVKYAIINMGQDAADNNYIEKVNNGFEVDGVKVTVKDVIFDKLNLIIRYEYLIKDDELLSKSKEENGSNLSSQIQLYDENDNLLYENSGGKPKDTLLNHEVSHIDFNEGDRKITGIVVYSGEKEINLKELKIQFDYIYGIKENERKAINKKINIPVSDKFKKNCDIQYSEVEKTKNFEIKSIDTSFTETKIKFKYNLGYDEKEKIIKNQNIKEKDEIGPYFILMNEDEEIIGNKFQHLDKLDEIVEIKSSKINGFNNIDKFKLKRVDEDCNTLDEVEFKKEN